MGMFALLPEAIRVDNAQSAKKALADLGEKSILAVDTETTGLSRTKDFAIILALSDGVNRYAVWPQSIPAFKDLLENPEVKLIAHNANFDQWMLLNSGIDLSKYCKRDHYRVYDTMVMHALLDDTSAHDLKSTTKEYLGIEMVPFKSVFGTQMRKRTLQDILLDPENGEVVSNYASLDAYATYKLFFSLREQLGNLYIDRQNTMWDYYVNSELKFTKVLWEMERVGILIDKAELVGRAPKIEEELLSIQKWFGRKMKQLYVNPNSGGQMSELFFGVLRREPISYTDKGKPQLNKAVLDRWAKDG